MAVTVSVTAVLLPGTGKPTPELEHFNKQVTKQTQPIKVDQLPQPLPKAETVVEKQIPTSMSVSKPSGSHQDWLRAAGIPEADMAAADYIVMHEGHYDPCVVNGGSVDCSYALEGGQKAYGVCQAMPGNKMASAGSDWATNPITQLRWCNSYAAKYGGWQGSYQFWLKNSWW